MHPTNWNAQAAVQLWPRRREWLAFVLDCLSQSPKSRSSFLTLHQPSPHAPLKKRKKTERDQLTNTTLLQPRKRIPIRPLTSRLLTNNIQLTIPIHAPHRSPKLYANNYQPHQPKDKQYKGTHDHNAGEELPLRDQVEHEEDEKNREGGYGYPVGEVPRGFVSTGQMGERKGREGNGEG